MQEAATGPWAGEQKEVAGILELRSLKEGPFQTSEEATVSWCPENRDSGHRGGKATCMVLILVSGWF